jgi:hypothetical protein
MAALEHQTPGFTQALESNLPTDWPRVRPDQVGLVYWASASWGAWIALSKDEPDVVADLPLAIRLARLAWAVQPDHGAGSLASLMGSFEAARPGGSLAQATVYFDRAITLGAGKNAGPFLGKAENIALPSGDRVAFEDLLKQALAVSAANHDLQNSVLRERTQWLLETADDLF